MYINRIKQFTPKARQAFIKAVTARFNELGIYSDSQILEVSLDNEVLSIEGREFDVAINPLRDHLVDQVKNLGYLPSVENAAYTWFNRICAIRYMELHAYFEHGFRLLSHPENSNCFEILEHAQDVAEELGLNRENVIELKLAGDKDEELYRQLLLAQCHQLHDAMPFLFSKTGDMLDLLLPGSLIRTDSPLQSLVKGLPGKYWQSLDVFPLLFEFYYAGHKKTFQKKIGKDELAMTTQVCEPKWISQFMVENTLARRWKEINPESNINKMLAYYLEPANQEEAVSDYISNIKDYTSKSPEDLKVLDPACGSGSNLLAAYELLYKIYQEQGYRSRDIPSAIFTNNLVGFDIEERAVQVSSLVLALRARKDDRRYFSRDVKPAIFNLVAASLSNQMGDLAVTSEELGFILSFADNEESDNKNFIKDAESALKTQYDVIICYPPNLGILRTAESLESLKEIANTSYVSTKSNLATMFVERAVKNLKPNGFAAFLLKDSWLFLSRYEKMRDTLFESNSIECLAHLSRGIIPDQHQMNAVVFRHAVLADYNAQYCLTSASDLSTVSTDGHDQLLAPNVFPVINQRYTTNTLARMGIVPGKPVSYWVPSQLQSAFFLGTPFSKAVKAEKSGKSIPRDEFVREWYELELSQCVFESNENQSGPWHQLVNGGSFRRWYGNLNAFVNTSQKECNQVEEEANTWTALTSIFNTRVAPSGSCFDASGPCFSHKVDKETQYFLLGLTNSNVFNDLVHVVYPENVLGSIRPKDLAKLPIVETYKTEIATLVGKLLVLAKEDWHSIETSWGFKNIPWLDSNLVGDSEELEVRFKSLECNAKAFITHVHELEVKINQYVIQSYELDEVVTADIPRQDLSYHNNPYYLYAGEAEKRSSEYDQYVWNTYHSDVTEALISYGIGCIMGRYRADDNGVVFAGKAGDNFNETYNVESATFKPDADGILPITDVAWFPDDAAEFFREWLKVTFGEMALDNNMRFVAESLSKILPKGSADMSAFEQLRVYLVSKFFKYHLKNYQKKPVYWLFSSGKHKAFECLVYMHRYNDATLARMRSVYVTPSLGKYDAYIDQVQKQLDNAQSTIEANGFKRELMDLQNKQSELRDFDDKMKHFADKRINIDLDDGVKVNYGKFGDLLAEVKTVTGKKPEVY